MLKQMAGLVLMIAATAGPAQAAPQCRGDLATIRVSSIKPGQIDRFRKAVTDHRRWLAAHGGGKVDLLPVYAYDPKARSVVDSDRQALTIVRRGGDSRASADPAYRSFVAEYQASSSIRSEVRTCLPSPG